MHIKAFLLATGLLLTSQPTNASFFVSSDCIQRSGPLGKCKLLNYENFPSQELPSGICEEIYQFFHNQEAGGEVHFLQEVLSQNGQPLRMLAIFRNGRGDIVKTSEFIPLSQCRRHTKPSS